MAPLHPSRVELSNPSGLRAAGAQELRVLTLSPISPACASLLGWQFGMAFVAAGGPSLQFAVGARG